MLLTSLALVVTPAISQEQSVSKAVVLHEVTTEGPLTSTSWSVSSDDRPLLGVHLAQGSEGAVIQAIVEGSPAAKAGLEAGDRILKVGKKKVKDNEGLIEAIAKHEPGDKVTIRVMRGKERVDLKATLARSGEALSAERGAHSRVEVLVEGGEDGSFAIRGLDPGDYLLNVDHDEEAEFERSDRSKRGGNRARGSRRPGNQRNGNARSDEDVEYWESEDGSERRIEIRSNGERISPDRIQELLREHGVDIDLHGVDMSGDEVEIDVHIESDGEGPFRGDRLLEVFRRLEGEDLRGGGAEHGERRGGPEGDHRGQGQGERRIRGGERDDRRAERGRRWGGRAGQGANRGGRGGNRAQGRRGRDRQQGQGRGGDHMDERRDRDQRGGWNEGRMRERDDRGEPGWFNQRDDRDRGQDRDREGREGLRGQRERDVRDERPARDHHGGDSEHSGMDAHERIQHLEEERGRNQEDLHRHREEMMRGFEDAFREMEEQSEERIRRIHEERERVIGELHERMEEVTRRFEEALHEAERGMEDRARGMEEERERRFEELHQREEEMGRHYDETIHELEERAEKAHD